MKLENTKKVLETLEADAKRMTDTAQDISDYAMNDCAKVLDGNAMILLQIHHRIAMALKLDGVDLNE